MAEDSENKMELKEIRISEIIDTIQKDFDRTEALKRPLRISRISYMRYKMRSSISILLLMVAIVIVLWFVLSRLRFVVFIPISLWGLLLAILGSIVVLFLVLDHFINRFR